MRKITFSILLALLFLPFISVKAALPEIESILIKIDENMDLNFDLTARVELIQQKDGEGIKVYKSIYYMKDKGDLLLIIITEPEFEKGNGYLKSGENFWLYKRNTRTFQHINRSESISGSDAKIGNFENRKFVEMYRPVLTEDSVENIEESQLGEFPVYKFELEARTDDVTYPKVVMWVNKDNFLPLKLENYSLSGSLMETIYYLGYTIIEGKYFCVKTMFVDEFNKGNKTLVQIKNVSLQEIDDFIFTKGYLESLSK